MADETLCNLLTQRKNYLMNRTPPVRNTPINPYSENYNSTDLKMRRKVEILKYNKNSTQGSRPTRTERFASLTRGNYRQSRLTCPSDKFIPTLRPVKFHGSILSSKSVLFSCCVDQEAIKSLL